MIGKMEASSGDENYPGIFATFLICLRLIFFSEKAFFLIYIDRRLTYNLISIYLLTLLIPYKTSTSDKIYDIDNMIVGIFLTLFFVVFLYLFVPNKKRVSFNVFLKLFFALEVVNIFAPITFLLNKEYIQYFGVFIVSWYLALSVFIYSKLVVTSYLKGFIAVMVSFMLSNIMIILS